ncbi:thermonuclease family protein [Rhodomicrobium vannielii]|uniref:thermonuclease family protein n=1 Tax=Rhodomicrobium vannielii TaxID=1069 RepID=UPI001AEE7BD0|nr:thermonuclease family protein [Rhodomicrobium vannielii]
MSLSFRHAQARIDEPLFRSGHELCRSPRGGNYRRSLSAPPVPVARSILHASSVFAWRGMHASPRWVMLPVPENSGIRRGVRWAGSKVPRFISASGLRKTTAAVCILAVLVAPSPSRGQQGAAAPACNLRSAGESAIAAVTGPQTLRLADSRMIRLAEIIAAPPLPQQGGDTGHDANSYLKGALGKKVEVKIGGAERDRYGVTNAHLFVAGDPPLWLQQQLVSAGIALAAPQADNKSCFAALRAAEATARAERRGNWGTAVFKILPASEPRLVANLVQTYQIVEGVVKGVARSSSRITLTFGDDKKFGFRTYAEGAAAKRLGGDGTAIVGKMVRIRGWVERKAGPSITATLPEQVEVVSGEEGAILR